METLQCSPAINLRFQKRRILHRVSTKCNVGQNPEISGSENGRMFVLGMGYVGRIFAAHLKSKGWVVSGTCTTVEKKKNFEELGFQAHVFDANEPQLEILGIVKDHTHLIVSIPSLVGFGDPMLRCNKGFVQTVLKDGKLQWLAYLSSTSVYGDYGGAWVDEDCPLKPATDQARARVLAEEDWLSVGCNLRVSAQVFRLGGIYGPGRSAIDTLLKQEPLSELQKKRLSKGYTSRAHVADICQALDASILKPSSSSCGRIYNIVDDDPAPRAEVFDFARELVEEKFPELGNFRTEESPHVTQKGSSGEKRVSNARLKKELGVKLLHPSYRSGLRSIIENMGRVNDSASL